MHAFDYYTEFYLAKVRDAKQHADTSVRECAGIFYCTERNAKLIIRKLVNLHWIYWEGGRGRGHKSRVTFLKRLDALIDEQINEILQKQQLDRAIKFIQSHALPEQLKLKSYNRIKEQFGYHTEASSENKCDMLRIPMKRRLATLDPAFSAITSESHIARQVFDCLVNYNLVNDTYEPHLAHAWDASDQWRNWTFYLRKGVHFHHGRELTAEDVRFTVQRVFDPIERIPCRWYFRTLQQVKIQDRYTITLTFTEPTPALLFFSALNLAILPADIGFNPEHIIGTGAFRIVKYNKQRLVFERFSDYFRERALLDRIELYFAPEFARTQRLYEVPNQDVKSELPVHEKTYEEIGSNYLIFNFNKKGPLNDWHFRNVFDLLIDRNRLIRELGENRLRVSNSFINHDHALKLRPSDNIEKTIKRLLSESTYTGETLLLVHFDHQAVIRDAEWIRQRALQFGICMKLMPMPMNLFYEKQLIHDADLVLGGEVLEENLELGILQLFCNESSLIRRMINCEQARRIDLFMGEFLRAESHHARMSIFRKLEQFIQSERLLIYLYHSKREITFDSALSGVKLNAFGWADFSKLWIKHTT
ncbi:ABC transporter substrate-binding protein, partial [Sporolactobacillus sp. CPB3-1]